MSQTNKPTKQEQPMTDEIQIPPGYAMRANGDLVKLENLTDLEREEDALVNAIFPRAKALHDAMAEFKYVAMNMIEETIKRCVEEHGIKKFTKIKGNVQFVSVNGNYKIQRAVDDRIEHDSSIEVAMQKFAMYSEDDEGWICGDAGGASGELATVNRIGTSDGGHAYSSMDTNPAVPIPDNNEFGFTSARYVSDSFH